MATVLPVYPTTRRNVELVLVVAAVLISCGAWAVVGLTEDGSLPGGLFAHGGGLGALAVVLHLLLRWRAPHADPVLLPVATLLNGMGLVMLHRLDLSEGTSAASRQFIWSALGIAAAGAVVVVLRDHRVLRRYTFTAMVTGLVLLALPLLPVLGKEINGARIWVGIGPLSFQPGEIAKIVLAVFFAGYLVVHRDALSLTGPKVLFLRLPRARDLGPILLAWAVSVGVLVLQRDLGTSLLFFGLFVAVLYVATERVSWIVIGLGLFVAGAVFAATTMSHVRSRVDIWLHPFDADNADSAYQLLQGLYGMASGGLLGTGLDRGRPDIVPFANSDFIYASFGEELGLAGLFALLLLYAVLVERGMRTAIGVRDGFGKLLAAGLAFSVALQVFVVVGGVTRVIPLTGLTTPFLAAGGSSLVSNWIVVALLLRVSDLARRPAAEVRNGPEPGDTGVTQAVRIP
ncbi:FtsW/RodA/SpoVE family cell cycle protein [Paenibacillus sp. TRM 82003]|uniref:FtsW/RodA/SpoVE family cell cycle protein n=1 Tax=Kineococcus sp. TRM81007 TaxID=2925831 RepID=UPI001F56AB1C|nr:FtsW/RodA/SpoVE family cell cycle protein [Kineococcus sp. TRM81007]MCI2237600.1 FtsW/RodA/SpoVE family cell cycle protein [Kineococcus sp. TRM81007]MCI3921828.1 FtsW/RodA/SpoVE family cell cycle protein [Paenibacillus sp. TRM 82003]